MASIGVTVKRTVLSLSYSIQPVSVGCIKAFVVVPLEVLAPVITPVAASRVKAPVTAEPIRSLPVNERVCPRLLQL